MKILTEQKILKGNKLIAEFMGYKWERPISKKTHKQEVCDRMFINENDYITHYNQLKYHSSWDWLMPVVLKISKDYCLDFELIIYGSSCHIKSLDKKYPSFMGTGICIEAVYECIIEFIKWHNQQKVFKQL